MAGADGRLEWPKGRWSPRLFLGAGVLLVGYAALNGIAASTETAYVMVEDVVGPAGFVLGFLGLLGLYPGLADRCPTPARIGAVCAVIGAAGFSVITIQGLARLAGWEVGRVPLILLLLVAVGTIVGYVSMAIASRRVTTHGRTVGLLLVLPGVVFAAMLAQPFVYGQLGLFSEQTMAWSNFAISGSQAVAHLSIGYTLWTGMARHSHPAATSDGTVG